MAQPQRDVSPDVPAERYEALQKEFDEFTYIVSHDLNAPLRHIREVSKILMDRLADKIGPEERRFAAVIEQSIYKTEAMINALLQYSRLNTRSQPFVAVDCSLQAGLATKSLHRQIEEKNARIAINALPSIQGDPGQIHMLFSQLLDNSLKFSRLGIAPEITIAAERQVNGWHFVVEDNGIGIGQDYQEKIFSLFRSVHEKKEIQGIGVGLPLCRKIVQRHGGRIWCESTGKEGARFHFTIPA